MSEDKVTIPAESPGPTWGDFYRKLKWAVVIVVMVTVAVLVGECHDPFGFVCKGEDKAGTLEKIVGTLVFTPLVLWLLWWLAEHLVQQLRTKVREVWRDHLPATLRKAIVTVAVLTAIFGFLLSIGFVEKVVIDLWPEFKFRESLVKDIVLVMFGVLGSLIATVLVWTMFASKIQGAASKVGERLRSFPLLRILFPGNKPDGDSHQQVANDESKAPVAEVAKPVESPEPENAPAEIPAKSESKEPSRLKGAFSAVGGYAKTGVGAVADTASKAGGKAIDTASRAGGWLKGKFKRNPKKGGD